MPNTDCVFCKIVSGEIQAHKLCEGRYTIAILDAFPATLGHTLIITKKHHENISTMTVDELKEVGEMQQTLVPAIQAVTSCEAYNLLSSTGALAGQIVMHAHFHIIPRYDDDGLVIQFSKTELSDDDKLELCEQIKENI